MKWIAALTVAAGAAAALGIALRGDAQEPRPLAPLLKAVVDGGAPGALVLVRDADGKTRTKAAGHARQDPPRRLEPTDRFRVASLTKVFTATLIMQLVQEGRLRLESPVEPLLPGLLDDGDTITVRDLLGHRSGLYDHTDLPEVYNVDREWGARELIALSDARPRQTGFAYSSTNYVVLGLIIEAVTGRPYEAALRERITAPLRLDQTTFEPGRPSEPAAHGHVPNVHDGFVSAATAAADRSRNSATWAGPAGAIVSTPQDIATFLDALLTRDVLLPRRLRRQMLPDRQPGERSYGLGLVAHPLGCGHGVGHTGNLLGTVSVAYRIRGRIVVAMTNQHPLTAASDAAFQRLVERAACR